MKLYIYLLCALVIVLSLGIQGAMMGNEIRESTIDEIQYQFKAGNYEHCIELSKIALEKSDTADKVVQIKETIGLSYFRLGQYEEAKRYTSKLVGQYPDAERIGVWHWRLALIDERKGNYNRALERYDWYINNYPKGDYVLSSLKSIDTINQKLGEIPGELSSYEKLIRDYPDNPKVEAVKIMLAEQLRKDGSLDEAVEKLHIFIQEYGQSEHLDLAYFTLANCYRDLNQPEKAQEYYNYVVTKYPDSQWAELAEKALHGLNLFSPQTWTKDVKSTIKLPPVHLRTGIEIEWVATPEYNQTANLANEKQLQYVNVLFYVKDTYAEFISSETGVVIQRNLPSKVRWDKGPGPYIITIDEKTGEPSHKTVTGRATLLVFDIEIEGESASSTFTFSEYIESLQRE